MNDPNLYNLNDLNGGHADNALAEGSQLERASSLVRLSKGLQIDS